MEDARWRSPSGGPERKRSPEYPDPEGKPRKRRMEIKKIMQFNFKEKRILWKEETDSGSTED